MVTSLRHKLAVLAIDPSSERSGGSILGDKTRMESICNNPSVFVRPSPSAGSLGGVARKTRETIVLCEAAGFDVIFIETVGVGQSETAVHSMVDLFMLLQISGAGDELQGIKRGIMEMADLMVITKADGENIHKAELAQTQFQGALRLFPVPESGWRPKVYTSSAVARTGLEALELVRGAVERVRPAAVIAVDALAARDSARLCATVQLSDTGLVPGSGVGNRRSALDRGTLGVPVIAVGIPTVVDADPRAGLFLTPRDIDQRIRELGRLLGYGITLALQPSLTAADVTALLG